MNVQFTSCIFDTRGLVKLGFFPGEDMDLYPWWSILDAKLSVYGIMDLVKDMSKDVKREMRPNTLGMPYPFLSIS